MKNENQVFPVLGIVVTCALAIMFGITMSSPHKDVQTLHKEIIKIQQQIERNK